MSTKTAQMLRKVIWTCLRGIQNKNIQLDVTNNMLCRVENTEIEVWMRPAPGTQQARRECYLFIIISLFHPWGYTRSWAWFFITYRWRHEDPKRDQDACWPQSSTRSIKPHCFSKDWFTFFSVSLLDSDCLWLPGLFYQSSELQFYTALICLGRS